MSYSFKATLSTSFDDAMAKTADALKTEGFGVLTEIDMQAKLKEKVGVDFKKYKILGACNPSFAYKALQAEDMIGIMLPCNVVVTEQEENLIEVAIVDPLAAMMAVENTQLEPIAKEVTDKLHRVIELLQKMS